MLIDGLRRLEAAEVAFLRECGWLPRYADDEAGDWTPPEDRDNHWDRERALTEAKYRTMDEETK